jgi:hypothetical protein
MNPYPFKREAIESEIRSIFRASTSVLNSEESDRVGFRAPFSFFVLKLYTALRVEKNFMCWLSSKI